MLRGMLLRLCAALFAVSALLRPAPASAAPPFFVYGATFFYERIPASQWVNALARYKRLGINTIDLYVMWNWHEPRENDFDFSGRSNPRRNLVALLGMIHADGFHVVLRPGPVIRNEWRNGGYPAWLLERPEYQMPLRDVLEGRYPATATLQNTHSDAAAREWLNNPVHLRYAARWLHHVLSVAAPWKSDIVAVALDDDQGAYLDNDTWPGPHFHRYIDVLARMVHRDLGHAMPVFINTYQMKVTASAPVWAWGNWYQSDAYSIGEHDRAQLEFTAGLLQTQTPRRPIMFSEFQAGWLQNADQPFPPPADPANTTLALHTLLQMGAHGVVNFPVQDTLNPAGWEAPWTNAFYSWDAAYSVDLSPQARFSPTAQFGRLMQTYGERIVQTQPVADAAVAYLTSAYDPSELTNDQIAAVANATISAQRGCRIMRITCAIIDLRYISPRDLDAYRTIIVPRTNVTLPYVAAVVEKMREYRAGGGRVVLERPRRAYSPSGCRRHSGRDAPARPEAPLRISGHRQLRPNAASNAARARWDRGVFIRRSGTNRACSRRAADPAKRSVVSRRGFAGPGARLCKGPTFAAAFRQLDFGATSARAAEHCDCLPAGRVSGRLSGDRNGERAGAPYHLALRRRSSIHL